MNATASESTAVAPAQSARVSLPPVSRAVADPRDKFITGGYVDNRGAEHAQLDRRYLPPSAPRGSDPRDKWITGGFMSNGQIATVQPVRRQFLRGYEIPEGEEVAILDAIPLSFARIRAACPINA